MIGLKKPDRFTPPLMLAFRAAFRDHDSGKGLDLKDDAGERIIPGRRASPRNAVSEAALRQELSDDLSALLNSVNMAASEDISQFSYVSKSILNYGLNDLTAISIDESAVEDIGVELKKILSAYEPRLVADSIIVERDQSVDSALLKLRFNVRAEMYATPVDVPVEFIADFEVGIGKMQITRL